MASSMAFTGHRSLEGTMLLFMVGGSLFKFLFWVGFKEKPKRTPEFGESNSHFSSTAESYGVDRPRTRRGVAWGSFQGGLRGFQGIPGHRYPGVLPPLPAGFKGSRSRLEISCFFFPRELSRRRGSVQLSPPNALGSSRTALFQAGFRRVLVGVVLLGGAGGTGNTKHQNSFARLGSHMMGMSLFRPPSTKTMGLSFWFPQTATKQVDTNSKQAHLPYLRHFAFQISSCQISAGSLSQESDASQFSAFWA